VESRRSFRHLSLKASLQGGRESYEAGLVNVLLLSEKLNTVHVLVRCRLCDFNEDRLLLPAEAASIDVASVQVFDEGKF
jgi:peptide subunit release factor 1 (eRF1)